MSFANADDRAVQALQDDWDSATPDERMELLRKAILRHALQLDAAGTVTQMLKNHGHLGNRVVIDLEI